MINGSHIRLLFLIFANLLIIGTFFYSVPFSERLLTGYNILLVFLSFKLSTTLCQKALQKCPQKNIFFVPNKVYRNLKILFLSSDLTSQICLEASVTGFLSIATGLLFIADLREFHHRELCQLPVLSLYFIQATGGLIYLWLGYLQLTAQTNHTTLCMLFVFFSLPLTLLYIYHLHTKILSNDFSQAD